MYSATPELPPPEEYTFTISVFNDSDITGGVIDIQVVGEAEGPHFFYWKETKEHKSKDLLSIKVKKLIHCTLNKEAIIF